MNFIVIKYKKKFKMNFSQLVHAEVFVLIYLTTTFPVIATHVIWPSIILRIVYPFYCIYNICVHKYQHVILDLIPLFICIYLYSEQGKISREPIYFLDDFLKHADANLFSIPVDIGIGQYLRNLTPLFFNKIFGEYLNTCYFLFYFILIGTPLFARLYFTTDQFNHLLAVQILVYLSCCALYIFFPAKGPYWSYPQSDPNDVGYFFSYITHTLVTKGSSIGTAFPSGHCSITTATTLVVIQYIPKSIFLYMFISPALVFATVWCGFHYFYDAFFGVILGIVCVICLRNLYSKHSLTNEYLSIENNV